MQDKENNGQKTANGLNNPGSEATQFKPGNPGGPGRPRGSFGLKRLIKEALWRDDGKKAKVIAEELTADARYDLPKLKFLVEQLDGLTEQ